MFFAGVHNNSFQSQWLERDFGGIFRGNFQKSVFVDGGILLRAAEEGVDETPCVERCHALELAGVLSQIWAGTAPNQDDIL